MKKILLPIFSLLIVFSCARAQNLQQDIQAAFNRLQQDTQCRHATISLTVLDAQTGEVVFAANPDVGLAPASTLKTVTAITAFNLLGPDFRFQTRFGYSGNIDARGTLNGDLIIKGGGDPTLGSWRYSASKEGVVLNQLVAALQKAGIKQITGRIIGDDSIFDTQSIPDGWIWQDMGNYYGAGTSGLCWRENSLDVKLQTGAVGTPVAITQTSPATPYITFNNEVASGAAGTGDHTYAYLPIGNTNMHLRGTYAIDKEKKAITVAIPDPAFDAAWRLTDTLKRIGVRVSRNPESTITLTAKKEQAPAISQTLFIVTSPDMREVVYRLNKHSINLYAEQMIKTMALRADKPVSTHNGVEVLQNFWKSKGFDVSSLNIYDGSGLSPGDRITTNTLAHILQSAVGQPWYNAFFESLPLYNNMHMKSGTIADVVAYAGYETHQGRRLCFSSIINNYNGSTTQIRQKLWKVLDELK